MSDKPDRSVPPNTMESVSIVIPTYNRGPKLQQTLESIFLSNSGDLKLVEIIVIDDGSTIPVESYLPCPRVAPPFTFQIFRQTNAGPAAARNAGFQHSHGDLLLCIDDDILVPRDLLQKHLQAHELRPGAVIFGVCHDLSSDRDGILEELLSRRAAKGPDVAHKSQEVAFLSKSVIASGQISFERRLLDSNLHIYRNDLRIPAAEEFELSARLKAAGVQMLFASHIGASHNQTLSISNYCHMQFTHGRGCAEASLQAPETLAIEQLNHIMQVSGPISEEDTWSEKIKKGLKVILVQEYLRAFLLRIAASLPKNAMRPLTVPIYYFVIALHFFAGVRLGIKQYSTREEI